MQYNLINNITPNAAKGSAIFGIFKGANISQFSYAFDKPELTKISNIIKSSSFQGEINESISIYETLNKNFEKSYFIGLGEKNKYNEKKFYPLSGPNIITR